MRDRRKMIELNVDSALALMQEIYNDIVEQKNNASLITKKMLAFMKEADDMALIGPVIKEQQKILNECMEKKISLVKLQNILIKQTGGGTQGGKTEYEKMTLSSEDREILQKLIEENDGDDVNNKTNNDDQIYKA
jgi:hypothetical protein